MANSRVLVLASLIIVTFLSCIWNEPYLVKADSNVITTEENSTDEEKLMVDCQHSDYRTYIQCLRHPSYKGNKVKRHFPEISTEIDHDCMDKCVKNCRTSTSHDCSTKCSHCIRRKKQKTQIITEYETECIEGDCHKTDDKPPLVGMANITTNMVINNHISTDKEEHPTVQPPQPPLQPPVQPPPQPPPKHHDDHYYHHYHEGHYGGSFGGLQLSLVPQMSLGLGLSPSFGCFYPYHWFCNHHTHQHTAEIDCSGCHHHSVNQYRCHSSCHGHDSNVSRMKREDKPCKSPHCVGGI